jgi:RNA polymerase primary sigma factor
VLHIGKGYENRLPVEEVMSIGALALTQAADRWDPSKGSMYQWARRWVTTALTKAVDASRMIRLPEAVANDAAHIAIRIAEIESIAGRKLSAAERAEVAGGRPTFDDLPAALVSLDKPLGGDLAGEGEQPMFLDEMIEDPNAVDAHEELERAERIEMVREALGELEPMEQEVVLARFAMAGEERQTLAALGRRFGVSAEAMRRVEISALAKLRHPALVARISDLL